MKEEQIRTALDAHWRASATGDANAEHDIYDDDAICDYPQSGERILGRKNLQALRSHHPGKPSGFNIRRSLGHGIHHQIPGTRSIHCKHYGVPQRQGGARDTVFCRSV